MPAICCLTIALSCFQIFQFFLHVSSASSLVFVGSSGFALAFGALGSAPVPLTCYARPHASTDYMKWSL